MLQNFGGQKLLGGIGITQSGVVLMFLIRKIKDRSIYN
jgi:hypothetical protein